MKIAILGTRGIPNAYGGFEQFAEYLSVGLVQLGHHVTVYNASFHEYTEKYYKGVEIRKIYSPENRIGASANFLYDFLCLRDALKNDFDIIYELGYHSNAPSYYLLSKNSPPLITNMDGIEWKRSKWSPFTRWLIKKLEKLAVLRSDYLVSDNPAIQKYYLEAFDTGSFYIPYGADVVDYFDISYIVEMGLIQYDYYLLIARLEPENNIEMVLDGYILSTSKYPFIVVGNKQTPYGIFLQKKYSGYNIIFEGAIYDKAVLDSLRYFSLLYFHGHSVGGTNPSLIEAMAAQALIVAHDNLFNKEVVQKNAFYFRDASDVKELLQDKRCFEKRKGFLKNNLERIYKHYTWEIVINEYEALFKKIQRIK